MFYIVGLGNPGKQYDNTRHNVGRDFLVWLAESEGWGNWQEDRYAEALTVAGSLGEALVEAYQPETFMNNSGTTVRHLKDKQRLAPEQLILIYDDVDLPIGELKIATGKGSGGHNGVDSVINALGSKDFARIRIGVASKSFWTGKPIRPSGPGMSRHVLGKFSGREQKQLEEVFKQTKTALNTITEKGVTTAMSECN